MLQAAFPDCRFLDFLPFSEDGFSPTEVDVGECDVVQALMVAAAILVLDKCFDFPFKVTGQVIMFQQDPVLHRLMPALDLTLGLWMEQGSTNIIHVFFFKSVGQITRDIG